MKHFPTVSGCDLINLRNGSLYSKVNSSYVQYNTRNSIIHDDYMSAVSTPTMTGMGSMFRDVHTAVI